MFSRFSTLPWRLKMSLEFIVCLYTTLLFLYRQKRRRRWHFALIDSNLVNARIAVVSLMDAYYNHFQLTRHDVTFR